MEVILKEDVPKLGTRGDVVKVAEGYGRNFLLPRKLAIEATRGNRAVIEQMKQAALRRAATDKAEAEAQAKLLEAVTLSFTRKAGEKDQLFGSVTASDIGAALEAKGYAIDRRKIHLDEPLKHIGEFKVPIRLYKGVEATVKVLVDKEPAAPEGEE
ncbi:MAG: 50S ribosomal protein L9 [Terriglobales bacterium]